MTATVDRDTETSGSKPADRRGPLAPFLRGERNVNAILRQAGSDPKQPEGSTKRTSSGRTPRSYGQGYRNQRGDKQQNRNTKSSSRKPRRPRGANTRPNHDRSDAKKNPTGLIPTTRCICCGDPVVFTNETRCEDCYAADQKVWHGRSLNLLLYK